jgi:hypothetical protein
MHNTDTAPKLQGVSGSLRNRTEGKKRGKITVIPFLTSVLKRASIALYPVTLAFLQPHYATISLPHW